jgi:homocysteine S-methyltransferase
VAGRLAELGADAIGVNCGEGPAQALRLIRAMRSVAGTVPLAARPNAGGPAEVGGRFVYPATPAYVAGVARALAAEGVAIVGGCCGTGPAHTAAIADALADTTSPRTVEVVGTLEPAASGPGAPTGSAPTGLGSALARGDLVVAVEMEPPRSFDPSTIVAAAGTLRDAGADVVDVADSPMAKMRMSAWAACRAIQDGAGIETTLHFPTRGRNLLRLKGDLLGAHALGIRNLFVCVGDPVAIGDYPLALNDVDVTATGLLSLITAELNAGRDRAGASIGEPTSFLAGAAVSPNGPDLDREIRLLHRKVSAGAAFLLSQPVYDVGSIERLFEVYEAHVGEPLRVPVLAGCSPR